MRASTRLLAVLSTQSTKATPAVVDSLVAGPKLRAALVAGGDERTLLNEVGLNSYNVGPELEPASTVLRSSCTCSPLVPSALQGSASALDTVTTTPEAEFSGVMDSIRDRLSAALRLPDGTGVITCPSGTDAELIPLAIAATLHQDAPKVHTIVTGVNEIGKGVAIAGAGRAFSSVTPLMDALASPPPLGDDLSDVVQATVVDARTSLGAIHDPSAAISDAVAAAADAGCPLLVHSVFGSKTNVREPFPTGLPASAHVVLDACQGRFNTMELQDALARDAMVLFTGSKFFQGPPFSGAVFVPPSIMSKLRGVTKADVRLMRPFMSHFFTSHDFPPELRPSFGATVPSLANRGLALRWHAVLPEMERFFQELNVQDISRITEQWGTGVEAALEDMPAIDKFERHGSILNVTVRKPDGALCTTEELRTMYGWLSSDMMGELSAAGAALTDGEAEVCRSRVLLGQPVKVADEFGVLRFALSAFDTRTMADKKGLAATLEDDHRALTKLQLCADHFPALVRQG